MQAMTILPPTHGDEDPAQGVSSLSCLLLIHGILLIFSSLFELDVCSTLM